MQGPIIAASSAFAGLFFAIGLAIAQQEEVLHESPFGTTLVEFVASHPELTLSDVAAFANARLAEHGISYQFYVTHDPPGKQLVLAGGQRRFVAKMVEDSETGPCGEHWLPIPAVRVDEESIDIVYDGKKTTVARPVDLLLDRVTVFSADRRTTLLDVHVPWQMYPDGITADGSAVLVYYSLGQEGDAWWVNVRAKHPEITNSYPMLVLTIGKAGLKFTSDPQLYAYQPTEEVKEPADQDRGGYFHRLRFKGSGLVMEFDAPCT
jgi:hypothetical protein